MQAAATPVLRDIVLIGGGHSHVGVLRMFAMKPLAGLRLTVICSDTETPYSGMLPGYIAGHYGYDEVHIDLRRLAEFAGARYYRDEAIGIDRKSRRVLCRHRPPVAYDALSINIGSTPRLDAVAGASEHAVPVKPIRRFNERWLALLERVRRHAGAADIAAAGILSSLHPANLRLPGALRNQAEALQHPNYPLLFDPQTAGGLLASVPIESAEACIAALRSAGYPLAARIGRVLPRGEAPEPIRLAASPRAARA